MSEKISDFYTEHFRVPGKQIEEWNQNKIALPEGAGAKYIAPKNLVAILRKPFYYSWKYETDGKVVDKLSYLVYGESWIDEEIRHFPFCKELLEINERLKKYGWCIPVSWEPIVMSVLHYCRKVNPDYKVGHEYLEGFAPKLCEHLHLSMAGCVHREKLIYEGDDGIGRFWSASGSSANTASYLCFHSWEVDPEAWTKRDSAFSVRCVSTE